MTDCVTLLRPLAPHFSSSFSADDLVSCILKMKASRRKLCMSPCICAHSAFPVVLWLSPLLPLVLPLFFSRALHGFSAHPILLPARQPCRQCFPLQLGYSYQHMDVLKHCSSLKTTETKTPPNTTSFFSYSPREFLWAAVLTVPFWSTAIRFFSSAVVTALVEITSDVLGDKFSRWSSFLISLEVAVAFDMGDNFFWNLSSLCFWDTTSSFCWFPFVAPTSKSLGSVPGLHV